MTHIRLHHLCWLQGKLYVNMAEMHVIRLPVPNPYTNPHLFVQRRLVCVPDSILKSVFLSLWPVSASACQILRLTCNYPMFGLSSPTLSGSLNPFLLSCILTSQRTYATLLPQSDARCHTKRPIRETHFTRQGEATALLLAPSRAHSHRHDVGLKTLSLQVTFGPRD
jgi:hypothetical protein